MSKTPHKDNLEEGKRASPGSEVSGHMWLTPLLWPKMRQTFTGEEPREGELLAEGEVGGEKGPPGRCAVRDGSQ